MQRAIYTQVNPIQFQSQATRVLSGHGTGVQEQAVNDDSFQDVMPGKSLLRMTLLVLGNVIGGVLLLSGMFILPHLFAGILS